MSLRYDGDGRFLVGIPADDLDDDALKALAEAQDTTPAQLRKKLVESGLYTEGKAKKGGSDE
jgi:hypothetical protein